MVIRVLEAFAGSFFRVWQTKKSICARKFRYILQGRMMGWQASRTGSIFLTVNTTMSVI